MNDILYRKVQDKLISSITEAQRHLDTLIRMEKEEEEIQSEKGRAYLSEEACNNWNLYEEQMVLLKTIKDIFEEDDDE